jgi:hypothetical protein
MPVAPVLGKTAQLAREVSGDEVVTGRTEVAGVVGERRVGHVLRAVATLGAVSTLGGEV